MPAAIVNGTAFPPAYADFPDPVVAPGWVEAEVLASAVHRIVRAIAAGEHNRPCWSASSHPHAVDVGKLGSLRHPLCRPRQVTVPDGHGPRPTKCPPGNPVSNSVSHGFEGIGHSGLPL